MVNQGFLELQADLVQMEDTRFMMVNQAKMDPLLSSLMRQAA